MQVVVWQGHGHWHWRTDDGTAGGQGYSTSIAATAAALALYPSARVTTHAGDYKMSPIAEAIDKLRAVAWKAYEAHSQVERAQVLRDPDLERRWRQTAAEKEMELKDAWKVVEGLI